MSVVTLVEKKRAAASCHLERFFFKVLEEGVNRENKNLCLVKRQLAVSRSVHSREGKSSMEGVRDWSVQS